MDELPPLLIVEDEPLIRLAATEALEDGGYNIVEAVDGEQAIAKIDAHDHLRALITDINFGGWPKGWEVARLARRKFPAIAVVYVTGDSAAEWSAEGVPHSVILQKPFADAELVTAVANLLVAQQPLPPAP